jgi:hypothetical protein
MTDARSPESLQLLTVEDLFEAGRGWHLGKKVSNFKSNTPYTVIIDGQAYPTKAIVALAHELAGYGELTSAQLAGDAARKRLKALGFPVKRGSPYHAPEGRWNAHDIRLRAAALTPIEDITAVESDEDWYVQLDKKSYPVDQLLGLPRDSTLSSDDRAVLAEAGAALIAAPDPVDTELSALADRSDLSTEVRREISMRIGQGKFRAGLLRLHQRCLVTEISTTEVLRAAHIHRWADCVKTPDARIALDNGLLLTANLDALFEVGLIAFDDNGKMLVSPRLNAETRASLGIVDGMTLLVPPTRQQKLYLAKHRERTHAMRIDEI